MPGKEKQEKSLRERDEAFARKVCSELGRRVGLAHPVEKAARLCNIGGQIIDEVARMLEDLGEEVRA